MKFWPGWMSFEIQKALDGIDAERRTKDTQKKRDTVLYLADGLARGRSIRQILESPETCALSTWFGKGGKRSAQAWSRDPAIVEALAVAQKRAVDWETARVARCLDEAGERLALAAVANVEAMEKSRDELLGIGGRVTVDPKDQVSALRAAAEVAGGMLDRADARTASKAAGTMVVRFQRPDDE